MTTILNGLQQGAKTALEGFESTLEQAGLSEPTARMALGGAIGFGIAYVIRPSIYFDSVGNVRPWKMISKDPDATNFPLATSAIAGAFVLGFLF